MANEIWPVGRDHQSPPLIGANFSQPQNMAAYYFHAGVDLRAEHGAPVYANVSGRIEAGYYSYTDRPDGHYYYQKKFAAMTANMSPVTMQVYHAYRFEIAIISDEGLRYEYHHVDPTTLPFEIRKKIYAGGRVSEGEQIGTVLGISFFEEHNTYDHIHFNVVAPDGTHLNPRSFLPKLQDQRVPTTGTVYYGPIEERCSTGIGKVYAICQTGELPAGTREAFLSAFDTIPEVGLSLGITKVSINYETSGEVTAYDFSVSLLNENGDPVDFRDVFQQNFCIKTGGRPIRHRGTTNKVFFYRLDIPEGYSGEISVEFTDYAGNTTSKVLNIQEAK